MAQGQTAQSEQYGALYCVVSLALRRSIEPFKDLLRTRCSLSGLRWCVWFRWVQVGFGDMGRYIDAHKGCRPVGLGVAWAPIEVA